MKTIIAGSRDITDYAQVVRAVELAKKSDINITEVVSGNARGVDKLGEEYARLMGLPVKLFPVPKKDWLQYGKVAGHMRNNRMAEYAEARMVNRQELSI